MKQAIYELENLCCANCAAKIEAKLNAHPAVETANIVFTAKQLRLTADDPDTLLPELTQIARSIEPDIVIHKRGEHRHDAHHGHRECCHDPNCDHEHHHEHEHKHHHEQEHHHDGGEKSELPEILAGSGLFIAGLILQALCPPWHIPVLVAAYLLLGGEVLITAVKNIAHGNMLDENFLMGIATLGAFAIGEFPEAVGVMLFYRIGEYFEDKAVDRSRKQIMDAVDIRPEVVHLESGETIPAEAANINDVLVIRPGDRIPLDGTVRSGESQIDTAPITGEPVPVSVRPGSSLLSGCINGSGTLTMVVEKPLKDSLVTRILESVENAAASKPKFQRFITRFARIYTPVVVGIAAAVALVPSLITGQWSYWIYTALSFLVMSCPCALVLSVPLAFFSGIGVGSRKGILFKGGVAIEALAEVKAVVLDKTGTLTKGNFAIQEIHGDILPLCAACEQHSTHPIAQSIRTAAEHLPLPTAENITEIAGHGVSALIDGETVFCGNAAWMQKNGIAVTGTENAGETVVYVGKNGELLGWLTISDTLKEDAVTGVRQLKDRGLTPVMLTGDAPAVAQSVAEKVGIIHVFAKLLPDEKLEKMQALRTQFGKVLFVGDGVNDAPVLTGADVGAAMGSGADAAIEAADVVFLTNQVSAVADAVSIARKTRRIARRNVIFALAIKLAVMILGLTGHASMWAAVFADSGVAMLCVLNSIRMLYSRRK